MGEVVEAGGITQSGESIANLLDALAKFQADVTGASKGGKNPHFRSHFVRLSDAWDAAREPMTRHGLSISQWPIASAPGTVGIVTRLGHSSGEWMQSTIVLPLDTSGSKNPAQQIGSTISYACRYAFLAVLGLPPLDDDGEAVPRRKAPPARSDELGAEVRAIRSALAEAETEAALRGLVGRINALPQAEKEAFREPYQARLAEIKGAG